MMLDHVNMFALDLTPILIMHSGIHCKSIFIHLISVSDGDLHSNGEAAVPVRQVTWLGSG